MPQALLKNYVVTSPILCGEEGTPAVPGSIVRAYLDQDAIPGFPEFIDMVVQSPVKTVPGVNGSKVCYSYSYTFEYATEDLLGATTVLRPADWINLECITCCQRLDETKADRTDVVRYSPQVTSLTGTNGLDKIVTYQQPPGRLQKIVIGTVTYEFVLLVGTQAENSPFVIRPDDYAATTNERYWRLLSDQTPGPYLTEADAAAAGVLVGQTYFLPTNGVVRVRL